MKILIVGLGSIAKTHITALNMAHISADIWALRSDAHAKSHAGVTDIYDLKDAPDDLDFIIISNPTNLHLQAIKNVLPLNKPLFIEKPVLRYVSEIKELGSIDVPTYVACQLRHHPCLQYLKEHLGDRRIIDVQIYCGSYMPKWVAGRDWKSIFRANKEMSGGVHLELIHEMDYCTWIFGQPLSVKSDLRNSGELGIDIIDDARYDLLYPDFSAHLEVNYIDRKLRRTFDITFEDGSWEVDLLGFVIHENGEKVFSSDWSIQDVYAEQMRYFVHCLEQGKQPMNSVQEACKVLTLALS